MSNRRRRTTSWSAGLGAAGAVWAFGLTPLASVPPAYADIDDLIIAPVIDAIDQAASGAVGALDPGLDIDGLLAPALAAVDPPSTDWLQGLVDEVDQWWTSSPLGQSLDQLISPPAAVAAPAALAGGDGGAGELTHASVSMIVYNDTEQLVNVSIGGGGNIPVVVDTGSEGLVAPWWDIGWQDLGFPTGLGIGTYSGGLDYFYITLPTTVDFGPDLATGQDIVASSEVDAVLLTWPTTWAAFFNGTGADGVLGIGANMDLPNDHGPLEDLPGDLSKGVLLDQANNVVTFGPYPLDGGVAISGAPNVDLFVSIDGGTPHHVDAIVDSGGVYGTLPSSVVPGAQVGSSLPVGSEISVYAADGQTLLYSYTVDGTNSPTVIASGSMNTGNIPFAQQPIYISYSPSGEGTTIFGGDGGAGAA